MARQTLMIPRNGYTSFGTSRGWSLIDDIPVDTNLSSRAGNNLLEVAIDRTGPVGSHVYTLYLNFTYDLSSTWETGGTVTLTVGSVSHTVAARGRDTRDPYNLEDSGLAALFNALASSSGATLVLDDGQAVVLPDAAAPTVTITGATAATTGQTVTLTATTSGGTYDGSIAYAWTGADVTGSRTGRTATVRRTSAGTANVACTVTVTGTGTAAKSGTSDTGSDSHSVVFSAPAAQTTVTANAGADKSVASGGTVTIGGSDTVTNGSGATVIAWTRVSGSGGSLDDATAASPTFTAPTLQAGGQNRVITWRKTVTNNNVSDTDDVAVTVTAPGAVPVVTTDTDFIYRRGTTAPGKPTGGTTAENALPSGWSRTNPGASSTQNVYRSQRTRTYTDGAFTSATAWGAVTKVADATGPAPSDKFGKFSTPQPFRGDPGEGGGTTEWIYRGTNVNVRPATPTTNSNQDDTAAYVPSGWSRNPTAGTYVWVSSRSRDKETEPFSKFSKPEPWRGAPGPGSIFSVVSGPYSRLWLSEDGGDNFRPTATSVSFSLLVKDNYDAATGGRTMYSGGFKGVRDDREITVSELSRGGEDKDDFEVAISNNGSSYVVFSLTHKPSGFSENFTWQVVVTGEAGGAAEFEIQPTLTAVGLVEGESRSVAARIRRKRGTGNPSGNIIVTASDNHADLSITTPSNRRRTFTPQNWSRSQSWTVRAAEDSGGIPHETGTVTLTASGAATDTAEITVDIYDDDVLDIDDRTLTVSPGSSVNMRVRLRGEPSHAYTIDLESSDDEITLGGSVVRKDDDNWDDWKSVTIFASDDANRSATITLSARVSTGRGANILVEEATVAVTVRGGTSPPPPVVQDPPNASAGTVSIANPISSLSENATYDFNASSQGGTYDTVAYTWAVQSGGGTITNAGVYDPDDVDTAESVRVRVTATYSGTGTNAKSGTSDTDTADDTFTVTPVTAATTFTVAITGPTARDSGASAAYAATPGGTATGSITYQWQRRSGTSGAWSNVGTSSSYSQSHSTAGTWQVRLQATRGGITATSNTITTVWAAPAQTTRIATITDAAAVRSIVTDFGLELDFIVVSFTKPALNGNTFRRYAVQYRENARGTVRTHYGTTYNTSSVVVESGVLAANLAGQVRIRTEATASAGTSLWSEWVNATWS